jgi:hypothetical protein
MWLVGTAIVLHTAILALVSSKALQCPQLQDLLQRTLLLARAIARRGGGGGEGMFGAHAAAAAAALLVPLLVVGLVEEGVVPVR